MVVDIRHVGPHRVILVCGRRRCPSIFCPVCWSHVLPIRSLGCHRRYYCAQSELLRRVCICSGLRMLSVTSMGCTLAHDCYCLLCSWASSWSGRIQTISGAAKGRCKTFPARPAFVRCYVDGQYTEYVDDDGVDFRIHAVRSVRMSAFFYIQYKIFLRICPSKLSYLLVSRYLRIESVHVRKHTHTGPWTCCILYMIPC